MSPEKHWFWCDIIKCNPWQWINVRNCIDKKIWRGLLRILIIELLPHPSKVRSMVWEGRHNLATHPLKVQFMVWVRRYTFLLKHFFMQIDFEFSMSKFLLNCQSRFSRNIFFCKTEKEITGVFPCVNWFVNFFPTFSNTCDMKLYLLAVLTFVKYIFSF